MVWICRERFAESQRALNQWDEERWATVICPALGHNPEDANAHSKLKVPGVKLPLFPYQVSSIWWCLNQEASIYRAGVLGDEMGFGKVFIPRNIRVSLLITLVYSPRNWPAFWSSTLNWLSCIGREARSRDTTHLAITDRVRLIRSLRMNRASRTTFHVPARTAILIN